MDLVFRLIPALVQDLAVVQVADHLEEVAALVEVVVEVVPVAGAEQVVSDPALEVVASAE